MLTNTGSRIKSIGIENTEELSTFVPPEYKQSSYHIKMDAFVLVHAFNKITR